MPRKLVAQQGGLGNLWLSIRWSRHRKDGVPKKLVAQ